MYKIDVRVLGMVGTNCYLLCNTDTKECVLIDPADNAGKISEMIEQSGCMLKGILLTHGHFDHVMAVDSVRAAYHIPVYAAEAEKETMQDASINLSINMGGAMLSVEADHWLKDGETITLLDQEVRCILTPGHTVGGMCFYFPKAGMLFSGDTLFQESVGRTDFPGGSMSEIVRSIREKLFVLPDAVQVYPGHGLMTSIKYEKMFNPFAVE